MSTKTSFRPWAPLSVILVTAIPLVLAAALYQTKDRWHFRTTNYGQFVTPTYYFDPSFTTNLKGESIPTETLHHSWWLGVVTGKSCDALCKSNLYKLETVRLALGRDSERADRMMLTYNADMPDLHAGDLFVADNRQQIVLRYPADAEGNGILRDLRRLFQIGH